MKNRKYSIIDNSEDITLDEIKNLFDEVFTDDNVGELAVEATRHMPGLEHKNWSLIKNEKGKLISGFAKTHWNITFDDVPLKVWEQAIVGTIPEYRGIGLVKELNSRLDIEANNAEVDMIIIQGIPGYYHKFNYRYSIELENHINLELDLIEDNKSTVNFRIATIEDFRLLKIEEEYRKKNFLLQSHRDYNDWLYQLTDTIKTEYSSKVYIFEDQYFVKIQDHGFGDGLIISEISENITDDKLLLLLTFLKEQAEIRKKPYLRFNLPSNSPLSNKLKNLGAKLDGFYAWQVKIINVERFLNKIRPVLEKRLSSSSFKFYKGALSLSINNKNLILEVSDSKITNIYWGDYEGSLGVMIPRDLLEPLFLGFRDWKTLQNCRPDIFVFSNEAGELLNILFPEQNSWLYSIW